MILVGDLFEVFILSEGGEIGLFHCQYLIIVVCVTNSCCIDTILSDQIIPRQKVMDELNNKKKGGLRAVMRRKNNE